MGEIKVAKTGSKATVTVTQLLFGVIKGGRSTKQQRLKDLTHTCPHTENFWFIWLKWREWTRMQQTLSDCEQVLDKVTLCPLQPHSLTLIRNAWMAKLVSGNLKDCSLCISQNILTICQYNKKEHTSGYTFWRKLGFCLKIICFKIVTTRSNVM